jgi:hypothetical protein
MKKIIWSLLGLILIGFTLIGCDPSIGYEYYLNNKSDSLLIVEFKGNGFNSTKGDSIKQVQPKTEILIYETEVWGKNPHDEGDDFLRVFDSIAIMTINHRPIKTDIHKRSNWKYDNDINGLFIKTGTNTYRLELTNDSI